ncbi:hypothetical protein B0H10DRAFT_1950625 [Mycena sp. CBHHK59/15]|nr:hypothetical protein B0H10DRAFT_1950625 [Mycena sp. CBHHK59/15]
MEDSPETGDLAQVAEGRFRVFDQTGEWVPVVVGAMHPYPPLRKYKFGGDDTKTPPRPNKKLKTKIPEIVMLRKNEWLGDLTETWGGDARATRRTRHWRSFQTPLTATELAVSLQR